MADALQDQFKSVFSDPNSINADQYSYSNSNEDATAHHNEKDTEAETCTADVIKFEVPCKLVEDYMELIHYLVLFPKQRLR